MFIPNYLITYLPYLLFYSLLLSGSSERLSFESLNFYDLSGEFTKLLMLPSGLSLSEINLFWFLIRKLDTKPVFFDFDRIFENFFLRETYSTIPFKELLLNLDMLSNYLANPTVEMIFSLKDFLLSILTTFFFVIGAKALNVLL